jgi:hypothetical protein
VDDSAQLALPCEAICSVLADQAWTLAGHRVMQGVAHQAVTPGAMAGQLWCRSGTTWGGKGLAAQDTHPKGHRSMSDTTRRDAQHERP